VPLDRSMGLRSRGISGSRTSDNEFNPISQEQILPWEKAKTPGNAMRFPFCAGQEGGTWPCIAPVGGFFWVDCGPKEQLLAKYHRVAIHAFI
jgi:hypothetical protein